MTCGLYGAWCSTKAAGVRRLLAVALAPVSSGFDSTELRLPAALPAPVPAPDAENSPEAPMRNARWNTVPPRWFLAFCFFWVNISFFA